MKRRVTALLTKIPPLVGLTPLAKNKTCAMLKVIKPAKAMCVSIPSNRRVTLFLGLLSLSPFGKVSPLEISERYAKLKLTKPAKAMCVSIPSNRRVTLFMGWVA
jgi:hypothetical protein